MSVPAQVVPHVAVALALALAASPAAAEEPASRPGPAAARLEAAALELEAVREESLATRRTLGRMVLGAGLLELAAGGILLIPSRDDGAWRFVGVNTLVFGVANTTVGALALRGIGAEERAWQAPGARAARRTAVGLERARAHALEDEARESIGHAVNLGLDIAYAAIGATALAASYSGVDHPMRWRATGVAVGAQAIYLLGVDLYGLRRSSRFHGTLLGGLRPDLAVAPAGAGVAISGGLSGRF